MGRGPKSAGPREADFLAAGGGFAASPDMEKLRQLESQRAALRDEVRSMLRMLPTALGHCAGVYDEAVGRKSLEKGPILEAYRGKIVAALRRSCQQMWAEHNSGIGRHLAGAGGRRFSRWCFAQRGLKNAWLSGVNVGSCSERSGKAKGR